MSISGLLSIFDDLPAYDALAGTLARKEVPQPLGLPDSARAAILARLYQDHRGPVLLLTGRVDRSVAWIQALETWLPEDIIPARLPEATPLAQLRNKKDVAGLVLR